MDPRKVFEGIVYVLRTGCQWKALAEDGVLGVPVLSINTSWNGNAKGYFRVFGAKGWRNTTTWKGSLGVAKHRWSDGQSPIGIGGRWTESDGSGKKMGPSEVFWSTGMESRCR